MNITSPNMKKYILYFAKMQQICSNHCSMFPILLKVTKAAFPIAQESVCDCNLGRSSFLVYTFLEQTIPIKIRKQA